MKVLLLGHTGFVGTNMLNLLNRFNIEVHGASRTNGYDLREQAQVEKLITSLNPDVIINCAAHVGSLNYVTEFAGDVVNDNIQMITALYNAVVAKNLKLKIINPVANCSYPGDATLYKEAELENGAIHPSVLSYGSTRRLMVALSKSYEMQYGLKTVNLLVPNMYGPNDSCDPNKAHALNALISKFVKGHLEEKQEINVWGTGKVVREWLYAEDFAKIVISILQQPTLFDVIDKPLNIAQNTGLSIRELVDTINQNFDNQFAIEYDVTKPDGAPKKVMCDENFRKVFTDFVFEDFAKGIKTTKDYYVSQYPY